mmetsp:Transcript_2113/g.3804  ORF Transcript_2113/g.3804 Transcript_2113/m.3804 type:complete len:220 (+) Transcript_2113:1388-2047(+)
MDALVDFRRVNPPLCMERREDVCRTSCGPTLEACCCGSSGCSSLGMVSSSPSLSPASVDSHSSVSHSSSSSPTEEASSAKKIRGPIRNTNITNAVAYELSRNNPPPEPIPIEALNHTLAAVVSPCTSWALPGVLACFQINALPKKPTPLGMAAETRAASNSCGDDRKACCPHMVKKQDPKDTRDIVRTPAGRSAAFLSNPMAAPSMTATIIRRLKVDSN